MKKIDKFIQTIVDYLNYSACVFLMFMMFMVTLYVIIRAVFGYAIFGTYEIVQLCSLLVVSLSLAQNEYKSGNITIDFLDNFVGAKGKKALMIFSILISGVISAICTYRMFNFMLLKITDSSVTANLKIPVYIFLLIMFISLLLLTICIFFKLIAQIVDYTIGSYLSSEESNEENAES